MSVPEFSLSVQFATAADELPSRAQIRRWVAAALEHDAEITVRIVDAEEAQALNYGRIDEVRLYRRALSGSELTAIRSSYIVAPIININGPGAGESAVAISWASENGQTYGVQTNSTLGSTNWGLFMSNIPGNGGTLAVTNIMGPNPTYYRVLTE